MQLQNTDDVMSELNNSEMSGKYLTFWTDGQMFGVPIADVVQIVGVQAVTKVPEYPSYAKGIINLRGSIIPIIDVRIRIGKPEKEYDERTCIIVTSINDTLMGFVVDAVDSVTYINEKNVSPPPKITDTYEITYITGISIFEDGVVLIIDTKKLLGECEYELMNSINDQPA